MKSIETHLEFWKSDGYMSTKLKEIKKILRSGNGIAAISIASLLWPKKLVKLVCLAPMAYESRKMR